MATNARLEELKKKFDENPRRYFAPLANEYRKQGDLTQAITLCRAHLPNQPGHISGHIVLAQALYEARELPESRQIFEQALELDPENLIALRFLGDIARAQDDLAAARGWYERVLDADPRNDEIVGLLRELAATPAPAPAAATEEFAPQQVQLVEPTAQPDAPEPVSWDPDKTPIANIAIPEPVVSASPAPVAPASADEPTDIFGEGTVDQGAELIDSIEPHAGSRSVFLPTPTQPVSGFELPVAADAAPELLDLSLSEIAGTRRPRPRRPLPRSRNSSSHPQRSPSWRSWCPRSQTWSTRERMWFRRSRRAQTSKIPRLSRTSTRLRWLKS
ncbi:MAG: tetratricopeptide repeat protein [Gemmatimonadaceae bacterium]